LHELLQRHDALRANFGRDGETLCVVATAALPFGYIDLADSTPDQCDATVAERKRMAVETPFDLETGCLFRAELLRLADDRHLLLLTAHHIVCDGWSWWVLVKELAALYARQCGADAPPLAPVESF